MTGSPILAATGVERSFVADRRSGIGRHASKRILRAVDGVDLTLRRGEVVGVVGESGSGKTTLATLLAGLARASAGVVAFEGDDVANLRRSQELRRRVQLIFQDAHGSLSPRRTVGSLITEPYKIHRIPAEERIAVGELLSMVGLSADVAGAYPHELSGGQARRVVVARALAVRPDVLIADEPTSGLDVSTAATVLNLLRDLSKRHDLSMLVITHDLGVVASLADRVAVMYLGQVVELGPVADVLGAPAHPYTKALRSAVALPDTTNRRIVLVGEMPDPADPPQGCRFRTRCPWVREGCERPPALRLLGTVEVRCHFAEVL